LSSENIVENDAVAWMSLARTGSVLLRSISGEARKIDGLKARDPYQRLHQKVADEFGLTSAEVRLCHGLHTFKPEDFAATLEELGLAEQDGLELAVLRLPRLTAQLLEGNWINSKGTRIAISERGANMAGLVTYDFKLDDEGTVVGIGDHLIVSGLAGVDLVNFTEDTWWRVMDDSNEFALVLRTVGGAAKRLESLSRNDTIQKLRLRAAEALKDDLDLHGGMVDLNWNDALIPLSFDNVTICQIGITNGSSILVLKPPSKYSRCM